MQKNHDPAESSDPIDGFDNLPDPIILHIFNKVGDIKTLSRCRSVSRRFNLLVPQTDSLLLKVDRVISATDSDFFDSDYFHDPDTHDSSFLFSLLGTLLKPLHSLFASFSSSKPFVSPSHRAQNPDKILRGFHKVRHLQVELPTGDLKLEKCTCIKWKAQFGKTLKFCVILAFRHGGLEREGGNGNGNTDNFSGSGLKMRVVWTISALIAASARHYMILDAIKEQRGIESLVIRDREMEGVVVMDKSGLEECRESGEDEMENNSTSYDGDYGANGAASRVEGMWWRNNRTTVPAVRMRMRHEARMELSGGVVMEGATLVIVRPIGDGRGNGEGNDIEEQNDDVELAMRVFGGEGGVYAEAVDRLLHCRSYILEMNSF